MENVDTVHNFWGCGLSETAFVEKTRAGISYVEMRCQIMSTEICTKKSTCPGTAGCV